MTFTLIKFCFLGLYCLFNNQSDLSLVNLSFKEKVKTELASIDTRGIDIDYLLSISMLETGAGQGAVFLQTNNLFSITADDSYSGRVFLAHGQLHKKYNTDFESILDVVRLLSERRRYRQAYGQALMGNYKRFFSELQKAGYAGKDKSYAKKLEKIFISIKCGEAEQRFAEHKILDDAYKHNSIDVPLPDCTSVGVRYNRTFRNARTIRG